MARITAFLIILSFPLPGQSFSVLKHGAPDVRNNWDKSTKKNVQKHSSPTTLADSYLKEKGHRISINNRKQTWPLKMWSRLTQRERTVSSLRMQSTAHETTSSDISDNYWSTSDDFIVKNFESLTPKKVLPEVASPSKIDSEYFDVAIVPPPMTDSSAPSVKKQRSKQLSLNGIFGVLLKSILMKIIKRHSVEAPKSLQVQTFLRGPVLSHLLQGILNVDAKVELGHLVFPPIRISNGTLEVKRMTLNLLGFLPIKQRPSARFLKQFDLHADDLTFTNEDLLLSPCIRNGLQELLVRILKARGVESSTIKVSSIDIMESGKLSCKGEALNLFGSPLTFEVRSGISTSSRGHVLTFPGLEVCINRDIGFFVPILPPLDLDIGHNARFRKIEIDGKKKQLRFSASVTITPAGTIRLNDYVQSTEAFAARFYTDVGRLLTGLCNFNH